MRMAYSRSKKAGLIGLFVFVFIGCLQASVPTPVLIKDSFKSVELNRQVLYYLDYSMQLPLREIWAQKHKFSYIKGDYINFKDTKAVCWLMFEVKNTTAKPQNLSLVTSGLDSVFYHVFDKNTLLQTGLQGTHIPPFKRTSLGPLQLFSFTVTPFQTRTILVKAQMDNYPLSVYPFTLYTSAEAYLKQQKEELFRSFYIGGMVIIVLFAAYMALFFKGKLYFYYLGGAFCSLMMVLIFNDYHYLVFETAPAYIRNKDIYGFIIVLLPIFYLFFAKEFVSYGYIVPPGLLKLSYVFIAMNLLSVLVVIISQKTFFSLRILFHFTIVLNTSLMLFFVFKAIKNGYQPAWFFVLATCPILTVGAWESLSSFHQTPIQKMHSLYYSFTLYEMYLLMLGLAGRFKVYQEGRKKLQQEMFEMQIQIEEKIRERIGIDLHDKVGGLLAALKINLDFLKRKQKDLDADAYQKVFEILDIASDETRRISHSMMSNQFQARGLVAMLQELYQDVESPAFVIQTSGMEQRLNSSIEMALYSIVNECVTNVLKHADATQVDIQLNRNKKNELTLIIEDDGKGFDPSHANPEGIGFSILTSRVREPLRGV